MLRPDGATTTALRYVLSYNPYDSTTLELGFDVGAPECQEYESQKPEPAPKRAAHASVLTSQPPREPLDVWLSGATKVESASEDMAAALARIRMLAALPSDKEFQAPNSRAVGRADQLVKSAMNAVAIADLAWSPPNVTASALGEVVFEWWKGDRKLTIYVADAGVPTFVKVWGPDISSDMEDGILDSNQHLRELWTWLLNTR